MYITCIIEDRHELCLILHLLTTYILKFVLDLGQNGKSQCFVAREVVDADTMESTSVII